MMLCTQVGPGENGEAANDGEPTKQVERSVLRAADQRRKLEPARRRRRRRRRPDETDQQQRGGRRDAEESRRHMCSISGNLILSGTFRSLLSPWIFLYKSIFQSAP